MRNDLLAIINLVAKTDPMAPYIEVGLARTVLTLFTFTETKNMHSLTKHLRFSECEEDFEFKRMLLAVIMNLAENPSVTPLLKEYKLLHSILYYIAPVPEKDPTWLPSQFEEIQLQCLASLTRLLPKLLEELVAIGGIQVVVEFMDWCLGGDESYKGHGNSVYGVGGRGTKLSQTKYILRILKQIISSGDEQITEVLLSFQLQAKYLVELETLCETMNQIVVHEFQPQTSSIPADAFISLDIICEILYSLAALMEGNNDRKESLGRVVKLQMHLIFE